MSGLIERDKIVFQKVTCPIYAFNGKPVENRNLGIYASKEQIDALPDVECEPVRHGHWNTYKENKDFQCSICEIGNDLPTLYCPNCGSKMDGKEGN